MKRRTGKTTAQALEALSKAIKNPGKTITFKDHAYKTAPLMCKYAALKVKDIVDALGLKLVTVSYDVKKATVSIRSEHYGIDDKGNVNVVVVT